MLLIQSLKQTAQMHGEEADFFFRYLCAQRILHDFAQFLGQLVFLFVFFLNMFHERIVDE
ncbi:hypothetical protein D3C86_1954580 [compost metagenome]